MVPEGFFISSDVVSEEAWEEISSYLGLLTSPPPCEENTEHSANQSHPFISIDGFGGEHNNQKGCESNDKVGASTKIPWESTPFPQNRPVAQFGFRYDYEKDVVVPPAEEGHDRDGVKAVPKIPEVFERLLLRPHLRLRQLHRRRHRYT